MNTSEAVAKPKKTKAAKPAPEPKATATPFGPTVDRNEDQQIAAAAKAAADAADAAAAAKAKADPPKGLAVGIDGMPAEMFAWPNPFNPQTTRVYRTPGGQIVVAKLSVALIKNAVMEPDEGADPYATKTANAKALQSKGEVIDVRQDIWGHGGWSVIRNRQANGLTEVLALDGQNHILVPPLEVKIDMRTVNTSDMNNIDPTVFDGAFQPVNG
jgi:hypothetical protein